MSRSLMGQPKPRAVVIALLTLLAVLAVRAHAPIPLRAPAGVLLVLALPGSPWILLDGRARRALESPALVVAASLGITMVVGFGLDLLPGGLTDDSWAIGLAVPTLLRDAVPWLDVTRPAALPRRVPTELPAGERPLPAGGWSARRLVYLATGCVALVVMLGALAWVSLTSNTASYRRERFTALSLNGTSANRLLVGIVDHEQASVRYRLTAVSEGRTVFARHFTLRSGATTSIRVQLPSGTVLLDSQLQIRLYRAGHAGIYRSLALTPREGRWL